MNTFDSYAINTSKITHELIDGEVVIINFDSGNYYCLNKTGADIWEFIQRHFPIADMVAALSQKYTASQEDIRSSLHEIMTKLQDEMLIIAYEGNGESNPSKTEVSSSDQKVPFEAPLLQKFDDMQELILLDPIHEVDESGWPRAQKEPGNRTTDGTSNQG